MDDAATPERLPGSRPLRVAVHQPGYHRHLYYFAKMAAADFFVSLDTVQYVRRDWQNRQKFPLADQVRWLSVPVNGGREPIRDKRITDPGRLQDHWYTIKQLYRHAPWFPRYADEFAELYARRWDRLIDLCEAITFLLRRELRITTPWLSAADLLGPEGTTLRRGELLAELSLRASATADEPFEGVEYIACGTPMRADHYLLRPAPDGRTERQAMESHGVMVSTFDYRHPVYRQNQFAADALFVPELSACDLLFNHGPKAHEILASSRRPDHQRLSVEPAGRAGVQS